MKKKSYQPQQARITIGALSVFAAHSPPLAPSSHTHRWRPPTDVTETDTHLLVTVEIAGMEDGEFHITLKGTHLAVSGLRERHPGIRAYHQMEISYGEFSANVKLPALVDPEGVEADYSDGFLTVRLRKQRSDTPTVETN